MKSLIESIKLHWEDFKSLFTKKSEYSHYTLDTHNDVQKVECNNCLPSGCQCNTSIEEDLLEPATEATPIAAMLYTKAELKTLSKLELQVIADNSSLPLTGKEKKQQIVNKLVKHLGL